MTNNGKKRAAAEALGTACLLAIVVGSGIMGERLAGGNMALALLANATATGAGLLALILTYAPISGAHFNPAVTLATALRGALSPKCAAVYMAAQCFGAVMGVMIAHAMFDLPLLQVSQHVRSGSGQALSEGVATFGLLATIWGSGRYSPLATPFAVSAYIASAYWFTASTSFANPAVTLARCLTDTFAGIRPSDAPVFIAAQIVGALGATLVFKWLLPADPQA